MTPWLRGLDALLRRLPRDCALCGQRAAGADLCSGCRQHLQLLQPEFICSRCALPAHRAGSCRSCQEHPPSWRLAVAAVPWQAPVDSLILECKRAHRFGRARLLADLLVDAWPSDPLPEPVRVVPIPASRAALLRRGFNPAGEIARFVALRQGWQCRPDVLAWHGNDGSQTLRGSSARVRRQRRRGSLMARHLGSDGAGGSWVVVDDVMTTGSTLHAATAALHAAGARHVVVAAVARTPPPTPVGSL